MQSLTPFLYIYSYHHKGSYLQHKSKASAYPPGAITTETTLLFFFQYMNCYISELTLLFSSDLEWEEKKEKCKRNLSFKVWHADYFMGQFWIISNEYIFEDECSQMNGKWPIIVMREFCHSSKPLTFKDSILETHSFCVHLFSLLTDSIV